MSDNTDTPTVAGSTTTSPTKPMGEVISIDQALVQKHLGEVVRSTVQDTLNALLDAEADGCAEPSVTSTARTGWTPAPGTTSVSFKRRPAR
ncbi:MAG: hypothetical protein KIT44_14745 [Opitutaceae bacterium]|nr:hypothetical protein [Opitutaceae bacterium]